MAVDLRVLAGVVVALVIPVILLLPARWGDSPASAPLPSIPSAVLAAPPPQESLLDLVPAQAAAALVIRKNFLRGIGDVVLDDPELRRELGEHLGTTLGIDLSRADGLVLFTLSVQSEGQLTWGVVLRLDPGTVPLRAPQVDTVAGVPVHELAEGVLVARLRRGAVFGSPGEVRAAIERDSGKAPPLDPGSPLATWLGTDAERVDLVMALAPNVLPPLAQEGIQGGSFTIQHSGDLALVAQGAHESLERLSGMLRSKLHEEVVRLGDRKSEARRQGDALGGAEAIISYHQMKRLERELTPRIEGDKLSLTLSLSRFSGGGGVDKGSSDGGANLVLTTTIAGVMAAVAIPAYMKYQRRSKTVEPLANLRRIWDGAARYYAEEHADGKRKGVHRFPPSVGWTPADSPCQHPDEKYPVRGALWKHAVWSALGFSVDRPSHYAYKFESSGSGESAIFTASARGDLNCDGKTSLFQRVGSVERGVVVGGAGLYTQDELE